MIVQTLRTMRRRFPLPRTVHGAHAAWSMREVLLVRLESDEGAVGLGEAAPLPGYSDETLEDVETDVATFAGRHVPFAFDVTGDVAAALRSLLDVSGLRMPSSRFALETALIDLVERVTGRRPAAVLRGDEPSLAIERNGLVAEDAPEDAERVARALVEAGYRTLKVKIGRPGRWAGELALLRRLRASLGAGIALRADANGAWSPVEARARLADLAPLGLEYVEQPVAPGGLAELGGTGVPLAADESLRGAESVEQLPPSCRVAVLKPMVLGGALATLDLARRARNAGLDVVVTGLFDGGLATRATAELALALDPAPRACGIGTDDIGPSIGPGPLPRTAHAWPSLSIADAAAEEPERVALRARDRAWTFAQLAAEVRTAIDAFAARGIVAGTERVALAPRPDVTSVVRLLALFEIGVPAVLLHPRSTAAEREAQLDVLPSAVLDDADVVHAPAPGAKAPSAALDPRAPLAFVFTSGSAGVPKAVELSRAAFVASAEASAANLGWNDDDAWLLGLPPAHVGGLSVITRCLLARRAVVLEDRGGSGALADALEREPVTLASLVPAQLARLLDERPDWRAPSRLRAVLVGGAGASPTLMERARERGMPVLATYGMSETCSQVATERPGDPNHVVRALPGIGLRVTDGRLEVSGPTLMTGYAPRGLHVEAWSADGWLVTGDRATIDATGRLAVLGRIDDVIVTGGENVDPLEVERALESAPGVARALVFGVPDATWGAIVAAAVTPIPGATIDLEAVTAHAALRLASHKRPRRAIIVPDLPETANGKPDRRGAAARFGTRLHDIG